MSKLLDGPVRSRAFWVFLIAEAVAIAASLGVAPDVVGQAQSVALHVVNVVFYTATVSGTTGTTPIGAGVEKGW